MKKRNGKFSSQKKKKKRRKKKIERLKMNWKWIHLHGISRSGEKVSIVVAMDGNVKDVRIIEEDLLRPVAMVNVLIKTNQSISIQRRWEVDGVVVQVEELQVDEVPNRRWEFAPFYVSVWAVWRRWRSNWRSRSPAPAELRRGVPADAPPRTRSSPLPSQLIKKLKKW